MSKQHAFVKNLSDYCGIISQKVLLFFIFPLMQNSSSLCVRFEVLTMVTMKVTVLQGVMAYSFVDKHEHLRGACWLYLQHGRKQFVMKGREDWDWG
jgi:hypothetical protein